MIGVISGLVAVVLLVLMVVALGMRSMNRRESALSPERIKAMAENKGPKPRRPAEETFFESFPQGFDTFEEPEERTKQQRSGSGRPGSRQARPAKGGGKQSGGRGRRGVDEWGDQDDYDDDYWSRVRADDGGFGGSLTAPPATPRPAEQQSAGAGVTADPDAATMQAPLPQRPDRAGLADLVAGAAAAEPPRPPQPTPTPPPTPAAAPSSALADQQTVTFSAPTPPDALGTTPTRSRRTEGPRSSRSASRRASAAEAGRTSGSFEAVPPPLAAPATPAVTPDPIPTTGAFSTGTYESVRGTGPFEAASGGSAPGFPAPGASAPATASGSTDAWAESASTDAWAESPRRDGYDLSGTTTGPFSPADTGPSYSMDPAAAPAGSALSPSAPGSSTSPGWPAVRDVLDDPEPPRASNSWPAVDAYQAPSTYSTGAPASPAQTPPSPAGYDDYSAAADSSGYGSVPSTPTSYEVSTGWATIDEADTVSGTVPSASASPYESAGYDVPTGQGYYGYDQQAGGYGGGQPSSWSEQNTNWSSYDQLYGDTPKSTSTRRGSHRSDPETEYPDYYR